MRRSRLLCLSDALGGSSPSLTSDVKPKPSSMKTTYIVLLALLFAGCAHQLPPGPSGFGFQLSRSGEDWHSRFYDFVQIGKAFAKANKLDFDFKATDTAVWFHCEHGQVVARVWFMHRPGELFFTIDVDETGKVIRYHLAVDRS